MGLKKLGNLGAAYLESWTLDQFGVANATVAQKVKHGDTVGTGGIDGSDPRPSALISGKMVVMRRQYSPQDGGSWAYIRWYYEGLYKPTGYAQFELETSERMVPIRVHENIYNLMEKYKGWEDDQGLHFDPYITTKADGLKKAEKVRNLMYGVDSFLDVSAVWRKVTVVDRVPAGDPGSVVAVPPTEKRPPPLAIGKRNWLTMPVRAIKRGLSWQVTEEWMLSGRGGWNEQIYYK